MAWIVDCQSSDIRLVESIAVYKMIQCCSQQLKSTPGIVMGPFLLALQGLCTVHKMNLETTISMTWVGACLLDLCTLSRGGENGPGKCGRECNIYNSWVKNVGAFVIVYAQSASVPYILTYKSKNLGQFRPSKSRGSTYMRVTVCQRMCHDFFPKADDVSWAQDWRTLRPVAQWSAAVGHWHITTSRWSA